MPFVPTEENMLVRESARSILTRCPDLDGVRQGSRSCEDLLREWADAGFNGLLVPAQAGGSGMGLVDAAAVAEELGAFAAPLPFLGTAVLTPVALGDAAAPLSGILEHLVAGTARIGFSLSPDGNTDDHAITSVSGKLSGIAKFAVETRGVAAMLVTDQDGAVHLVRTDAAGFRLQPQRSLDVVRPIAALHLDATPAERLGDRTLRDRLVAAARIVTAADTLGASGHMLQSAVAFSLDRKQFDRPIGSFQAIKHLCAEMAAAIESSRALVSHAAWGFDQEPAQSPLQAILVKSHLDDVGSFVARRAIEVHGAVGLTDALGLHFWWKRIAFNRTVLGAPDSLPAEAARMQSLWS